MDIAGQRKIAVAVYFVYIAVFYLILAFEIEPFFSYGSTFGLIGNLMAAPMFWAAFKIHCGQRRWTWVWFAMTCTFYFIGDLLWAYSEDFLGIEPESPSICDLFYLLNSYTCCCACICYMRQIKEMNFGGAFFDIIISVVAASDLMYNFILNPMIKDNELSLFELFNHANMSVIDLSLFAGTMMMIFGTIRSRFYTKRTLLLALSFFYCCFIEQISLFDMVYGLDAGILLGPLWALPFWLFALTSMYPDEDETDEEEVEAVHKKFDRLLHYTHLMIPYILALVLIVLINPSDAVRDPGYVCTMIMIAIRTCTHFLTHYGKFQIDTCQ